nr:hypothetical protein [Streptomyces odonnellii]
MNALPAVGSLLVDTAQDRLGEFRGEWCGQWSLRPVGGGREWSVAPENVRPATGERRLPQTNARSRGELL